LENRVFSISYLSYLPMSAREKRRESNAYSVTYIHDEWGKNKNECCSFFSRHPFVLIIESDWQKYWLFDDRRFFFYDQFIEMEYWKKSLLINNDMDDFKSKSIMESSSIVSEFLSIWWNIFIEFIKILLYTID
jgi:hypothetical protein